MSRYALLIHPSSNRVYAADSVRLTQAELTVFSERALDGRISTIEPAQLGGTPYLTFQADQLTDRDLGYVANLSSIYALFQIEGDLLRPVELHRLDRFDDDLVTILKYQGKTNEHFTKLLLNVTLLTSAFADQLADRQFTVIDPLCGRGTTLNQALRYGFNASGIDLDQRDFELYSAFIKTWLKRKRVKHQAESGPVRRDRRVIARRLQITLAASRDDYRSGVTQRLDFVNADTIRCLDFFRPESHDLLVTDAPYGVQHGSRSAGRGLARTPLELLGEALPVWARLLRPGGALGLSWNTCLARREAIVELLIGAGLAVAEGDPYLDFRHRVDQAIVRDLIVASKPLANS